MQTHLGRRVDTVFAARPRRRGGPGL